ncbi:hypothetical protein GCM10007906_20160 [Vibrio hyugaensis]|uniref:Uncharacterized protein n=1 Tax=Vibrio hyugaensis TaxID=1534743 RepID=A0ABQ5Y0H6_9VIBR|nr:hypothetical protein [Vibrio hyugaensis]GLR04428.1 hypothetical protein GCM10007906_20160 [Vibrio hyugaensis]
MKELIVRAIQEKLKLEFTYDGYLREVLPHCYGRTTAGNDAIRCYQISGGSASGTVPGWHLMTVNKMVGLKATTHFESASAGYKPGDRGMSHIYCEL